MELHLSVTESAGRLTGTARRSNGDETIAFSGALELLACIERLCLPVPDRKANLSTATKKDN
jgi:hypothetical protein